MTQQAKCKSCGAPIIYRYTPAGKLMPLDVAESKTPAVGMYVVVDEQECRPSAPMFDSVDTVYRMSHWATCPKPEQFR